MTLPKNVEDAVTRLDTACVDGRVMPSDDAWQTIRAHLMSQEAEVARLNAEWHEMFNRALLAESRLAAANALLLSLSKQMRNAADDLQVLPELQTAATCALLRDYADEIQSHLQGAGDE